MRIYDVILNKRNGKELTDEEIAFFVSGYTSGEIPDYQASALLMAIYFNGMTERETATLTDAMARSGDTVDLSCFGELSADKHSTGGVGDKTSFIVGPIVASLGGKVTKMSGRGLGHTGGTVDKLESIPGYKINLSNEEFISQVDKVGMAIIGQSGNLTPADKKIYALRDVTATVDSIPLITSSIMSKKIASGSHSIVLDVKVGSGAFMKTPEDAKILAENMVKIGKRCGRNMAALITNMDSPLGNTVGNALEIKEAVAVLKGEQGGDLKDICIELSAAMLSLIYDTSLDVAREKALQTLKSGKAYEKMLEWISAQGGDTAYIEDTSLFPKSAFEYEVTSDCDGFITSMDTEGIGVASVILGAGRMKKDEKIDYSAGIVINKKTGDKVSKGDTLCTLYTNDKNAIEQAKKRYLSSLTFGQNKKEAEPLVYGCIS
ncbi:MAG: pyrimidine-nucleoside phosphorylase [Clostridia bacterium]|nr:pyrimidine-nucleoside phosphorylase [Clostridia bacterium]